jgi:hypothetical protein
MSQRLYHALVLKLSGEGATALALLEAEFKAPTPDVDKIIELATEINRMENALTVLKGYIGPRYAPLPTAAPPPPAPPVVEAEPAPPPAVEAEPAPPKEKTSRVVDETVSPRFKRVKKLRESSKTTTKKKKDKSDD